MSSISRRASFASLTKSARFPFAKPTWPGGVARSAPPRRTGLAYDHDWSRSYPVRLARAMVLDNITRPALRLLAPTVVRGIEHLERTEGPVILAANHSSHLDTPVLLSTLPVRLRHRTVVAAASDYFFDRTWKAALWSFALAAVPIERSKVNRRSADMAADLVEDGWNLLIYPEGGRSPDGWLQEFRGGAAYLSRRTGRPVIPVHLHGTREVLAKSTGELDSNADDEGGVAGGLRKLPRRSPVTVTFGEPLVPAEGEDARRFGARIERAVGMLADEFTSDWYTARLRAHQSGGDAGISAARGPQASAWRRSWARQAIAERHSARESGSNEAAWPRM